MKYFFETWNNEDFISVTGFDDESDEDLYRLVELILKIIDSSTIYFEWCRTNFFYTVKQNEQNSKLLFECFEYNVDLRRISTDTKKVKSKLYVGYKTSMSLAKKAIFYAWRAYEDVSFFSLKDFNYEKILEKYDNKMIGYGGFDLIKIVNADVAISKNDTGDTLMIHARNLDVIENKLIDFGIIKSI